ncbi:hypothetical protein U1Q18_012369, partial [Sarracenia purpurea var. burkii]
MATIAIDFQKEWVGSRVRWGRADRSRKRETQEELTGYGSDGGGAGLLDRLLLPSLSCVF